MNTIASLLQKTSRTFAVTIPLLPEPTRQEVGIAYLLFRVVDTFEDATLWSSGQQEQALVEIGRILHSDDRPAAQALAQRCAELPPVERAEYLELLRELPYVLDSCASTRPAASAVVRSHAAHTAAGMIDFVRRSDRAGNLQLQTLQDLRDYSIGAVIAACIPAHTKDAVPRIAPHAPASTAVIVFHTALVTVDTTFHTVTITA